jgi:hypothetical protein
MGVWRHPYKYPYTYPSKFAGSPTHSVQPYTFYKASRWLLFDEMGARQCALYRRKSGNCAPVAYYEPS